MTVSVGAATIAGFLAEVRKRDIFSVGCSALTGHGILRGNLASTFARNAASHVDKVCREISIVEATYNWAVEKDTVRKESAQMHNG